MSTTPQTRTRRTRTSGPTVDQARAFCIVGQCSSYQEAAHRLGINDRETVSRLVSRFTAAMGRGKLVSFPTRGRPVLTSAGEEVYRAACRFVDAAAALTGATTQVRFSTYPTIAARLATVAPELVEGESALELHDISDANRRDEGRSLVERTLSGELDVVIAPAGLGVDGLDEHLLYDWRLRIVLPQLSRTHALYGKEQVTPRDLVPFRVLAAPPGHRSRALLHKVYAHDGVRLDVAVESTDPAALRQIAESTTSLVAAIPDDTFDRLQANAPSLVDSDGQTVGGAYALYVRTIDGSTTERTLDRERDIARLADAVHAAFASRESKRSAE